MHLAQQLKHAQCSYPFSQLGPVLNDEKTSLTVTVWMPNAEKISVIDLETGKTLGKLKKTR